MLYKMSKQKLREIGLKKWKAFQNPSQICPIKSFPNHLPYNLRSLFNDLTWDSAYDERELEKK